jgi:hypothetical protein
VEAIVIYSIVLLEAGFTYPKAYTPLVEEERPLHPCDQDEASPKSVAFPVEAVVI